MEILQIAKSRVITVNFMHPAAPATCFSICPIEKLVRDTEGIPVY
jgi:hypothetical protein